MIPPSGKRGRWAARRALHAALMLTTEALVADIKEEGKMAAAGAGHGGGMGGMY